MLPSEHPDPSSGVSVLPKVMFVISAAVAALTLRLAWEEPFAGVVALVGIGAVVMGRYLSRRRTRRLLRSGDVETIISRWSSALDKIPHAETMAPLMTATAFAAHGWVDRARQALRAAARGPAWEAALEHRLFVDTLLLTFEGDNDGAMERAAELSKLPLPDAGPLLVARVKVLRAAVGALVRAFSHRGDPGDRKLLLDASDASPLVHWAMRYGAAILAVDRGDLGGAHALLQGAPQWPVESRFNQFHNEITAEVSRRVTAGESPQPAESPRPAESPQPLESPLHGEATDTDASVSLVDEEDGTD